MSEKESLRMSILSESNPLGSKRRFGLFSQPISTAVGDDGAFRVKIRKYRNSKIQKEKTANPKQNQEISMFHH